MAQRVRTPHVIPRPTNGHHPNHIVFVDTETEQIELPNRRRAHRLRLWCADFCSRNRDRSWHVVSCEGSSAASWWDHLARFAAHPGQTWVMAHGAYFDATTLGLWDLLEKKDSRCEWFCVEDPPFIVDTVIEGAHIKWIDTLNYWRMPLREIGQSIGLPKLEMPSADAPTEDWLRYCRRDVEIIRAAVQGLMDALDSHGLGWLQTTAAATAWSSYRRGYMDHPIHVHDDTDQLAVERSALFPGLLECWRQGRVSEAVHVYDVNGLYPSVMAEYEYPCRLVRKFFDGGLLKGPERPDTHALIVECGVNSPGVAAPCWVDGRLAYCTGRYDTFLCGPDFWDLEGRGLIEHVRYGAWYERAPLFRRWVGDLYGMRLEARGLHRPHMEALAKLLLNSLWGKFAQRNPLWHDDPNCYPDTPYAHWSEWSAERSRWESHRALGWAAQTMGEAEEWEHSCPAIAAYVTCHARRTMLGLREIAGPREVYYCDTDSLHVSPLGRANLVSAGLVHPDQLGRLKLVCEGPDAEYFGLKHWRVGVKEVCAGLKANARRVREGVWEQDVFPTAKTLPGSQPPGCIVTRTAPFVPRASRLRGIVGPDGWVRPWNLPEELP